MVYKTVAVSTISTIYNRLGLEGKKVFIKMDIEGSEFDVLREMIKSGLMCANRTMFISIEFHCRLFKDKHNCFGVHDIYNVMKILYPHCVPTYILELDDESYLDDGQPLPCS